MELVEGQPLDKLLREEAPLPLRRARALLREIARGLEAAHALRIVHRDLKPSNVVVAGERVKILDFGIARLVGQELHLTAPGDAIGSPMYMSPEQIRGTALDGRSDFYSLGVLAFQALTGRAPFTGQSSSEIILKHLQDAPADIRELRPGLPEEWQAFVARLLSKAPAGRYPDAPAVLEAIAALPEA
jgi:serine/threonine-protein kinase